jgi:hypothetical protein
MPEPVQRYLRHALGDEGAVPSGVRLTMAGRIRVGRWLAFTAEQAFCGHDYEWRARAGIAGRGREHLGARHAPARSRGRVARGE